MSSKKKSLDGIDFEHNIITKLAIITHSKASEGWFPVYRCYEFIILPMYWPI